jgi:mRNA interferase MazF
MTSQPGEFWVADIRFSSGRGSKVRPVLILWLEGNDVVTAVVTSAAPRTARDVTLADWRASGLQVPSTVRLSHLGLERPLLLSLIGAISASDGKAVKQAWASYVQPQF